MALYGGWGSSDNSWWVLIRRQSWGHWGQAMADRRRRPRRVCWSDEREEEKEEGAIMVEMVLHIGHWPARVIWRQVYRQHNQRWWMLLAPSKGKAMTPAAVKECFDVTLAGGDVSLPTDFPPACSTSLTNLGIFHFVLSNSAAEENGFWTLGAAADCYCFGSSSPGLSRAVVKLKIGSNPQLSGAAPRSSPARAVIRQFPGQFISWRQIQP